MAFFEKIQQHGIGADTGKKCGGKCRTAVITQVAESKQRPGYNGQMFDPARNFDDLPDEQPDGDKQHQAGQRPQKPGDKLSCVQLFFNHQGAQNDDQRNAQRYEQGSGLFCIVGFRSSGLTHLALNISIWLSCVHRFRALRSLNGFYSLFGRAIIGRLFG